MGDFNVAIYGERVGFEAGGKDHQKNIFLWQKALILGGETADLANRGGGGHGPTQR